MTDEGRSGDRLGSRCRAVIDRLEQLPQRQDGVDDQVRDVLRVATKLGCYDAADWIRRAWSDPRLTNSRSVSRPEVSIRLGSGGRWLVQTTRPDGTRHGFTTWHRDLSFWNAVRTCLREVRKVRQEAMFRG